MKMYRVHCYESERGWGTDSWNTDFTTEEDALHYFRELEERYGGRDSTPDYYIIPTYIGEVSE